MAGLQRSAVSFRRQGSSGLVWDDKVFSGELTHGRTKSEQKFLSGELRKPSRLRNVGSSNVIEPEEIRIRPIRTNWTPSDDGRSSAAASDPPSPKLTACGCCGGMTKSPRSSRKPRTR